MRTIKIITKEDPSEKYQCWCTTNNPKFYIEFIQYILDSANNPEIFIIWDVIGNHFYDLYEIATKHYGMRKRTFEERMNNVVTGRIPMMEE